MPETHAYADVGDVRPRNPRSLRTIEGFGIHTFKLVQCQGQGYILQFHWKPKLGMQSTLWDRRSSSKRRITITTVVTCTNRSSVAPFRNGNWVCRCFDQEFADAQTL